MSNILPKKRNISGTFVPDKSELKCRLYLSSCYTYHKGISVCAPICARKRDPENPPAELF